MSLASWLFGRLCRLPAPITRDIASEPLRIPMRDGAELLADRYYPRHAAHPPTVLIRSCYGRSAFKVFATLFAERGMQVVMQSCRGTCGSQGTFRPFFDEQNDGEDTVEWIERQQWFSGKLALWGLSYLGNTAWAVAGSRVAPKVDALGLHVTLTNFRDRTYAFDGFTLISCFGWTLTMVDILRTDGSSVLAPLLGRLLARCRTKALSKQAAAIIPLRKADRLITPEGVSWWQDWMDHAERGDPWWDATNYGAAAQAIPPAVMVAGWYDIFLPFQLRDFEAAQHAGRGVRITIGPWTHVALPGLAESLRQSIALFQEKLGIGSKATGNPRVCLLLMGANEWREYPSWPPPNTAPQTFNLHPSGVISADPPALESESTFVYDPAQPTPALHGAALDIPKGSGDMAELEARSDVLVFTTKTVASDVAAIGPVSAEIFLRSNTKHTDVYLCLCDVTSDGRSTNVCDGYRRLRPGHSLGQNAIGSDDARKVNVEFWPTAYRFRRGHRIRIIVASGAHPRSARNLGSGEPLGDATTMIVAHQHILHGPEHPSSVMLTVVPAQKSTAEVES